MEHQLDEWAGSGTLTPQYFPPGLALLAAVRGEAQGVSARWGHCGQQENMPEAGLSFSQRLPHRTPTRCPQSFYVFKWGLESGLSCEVCWHCVSSNIEIYKQKQKQHCAGQMDPMWACAYPATSFSWAGPHTPRCLRVCHCVEAQICVLDAPRLTSECDLLS